MIRRKKEMRNGKIRDAGLSDFQQSAGYSKKGNLNTGHIAVRADRSDIQRQKRKTNDGLFDSGSHRHPDPCMQYPDTGAGRYGRWLAASGTGVYAPNGKLHSDGMYRNAACSGMFRCPAAGVSKEQKDGDPTGTFFIAGIYRRTDILKKTKWKVFRCRAENPAYISYRRSLCKGSFTIEAACVMSIVLLTVMGVIYLSFFVHNRAWLTAAACEASLSGSMEAVYQDGQSQAAAEIRGEELGNVGFFGAENLRCHVNAGKKKVSVAYEADTIAGFGGFKWTLKTEGSSKVIQPVKWIRRLKAAKEAIGITGD